MTVAYGKLYMKDSSGSIVQIVPESLANGLVDSSSITYQNGTVSSTLQDYGSSIQSLQTAVAANANNGFKSVATEMEGKTSSTSETVHVYHEGWIGSTDSSDPFHINLKFGYGEGSKISKSASVFTQSGGPENEGLDAHRLLKSNVKYTSTFTFDDVYAFTAISIVTASTTVTTFKNGRIVPGKYAVLGSETLSSSEYTSWSYDGSLISLTFPTEGNPVELTLNGFYSNGAYAAISDDPVLKVKLSYVSDTSYSMEFWWEYEEDVVQVTSTRWKELKTTTVLPDDTTKIESRAMSGILQDVTGSLDEKYSYDYVTDTLSGTTSLGSVTQKSTFSITKEDAAGTKTTESIQMKPSTIVSYSMADEDVHVGDIVDGFVCGVDASNLAIGGLYFEVESTIETSE